MKLRPTLLALASLVMMASLTSASPPAQSSTPADPVGEQVAFMSPEQESSGCMAAQLASFDPKPTEQASSIPCGACSSSSCQGRPRGSICGYQGGQYYYCQPWLGELCPGTVTWECSCGTGPYP
jgi:hypothetical protein